MDIICAQCGNEATIRADGSAGRFCTRSCAAKWRHAHGKIPPPPSGSESPYFKGANATYSAMHKRVVRLRGAANHCEQRESAGCTSRTYHWAWIHDTDPSDPMNYRQLCRVCHSEYDGHVGAGNARAKLTMDDARAIRAKKAAGVTPAALAAQYGIHQGTVSRIILNRAYREPA